MKRSSFFKALAAVIVSPKILANVNAAPKTVLKSVGTVGLDGMIQVKRGTQTFFWLESHANNANRVFPDFKPEMYKIIVQKHENDIS